MLNTQASDQYKCGARLKSGFFCS